MDPAQPGFLVRSYEDSDAIGWVRCRALSFLDTQYYDDVKPKRAALQEPAIALVAVSLADRSVIGVLDIEIEGGAATIDTIATHPDQQRLGVGSALLEAALQRLTGLEVVTLDAWTREDAAANAWYRRNGFSEDQRYLHVYLGPHDDAEGFRTPEGLSAPVTALMHGDIDDEADLRRRFRRVHTCRRYVRRVQVA